MKDEALPCLYKSYSVGRKHNSIHTHRKRTMALLSTHRKEANVQKMPGVTNTG